MKLGIIIQARTASTRLPGKVLMPFYKGKSILQIQIEELQNSFSDTQIIVATSLQPYDDPIEALCASLGVPCFRGSEVDVLNRFNACAERYGLHKVVRVCSDNPFLLGKYVEDLTKKGNGFDYLSYRSESKVPSIKMHWGLFAEFVSAKALEKTQCSTKDMFYHEHVTNYIYGHPQEFKVELLPAPSIVIDREDLRFTIDTKRDFEMAQELYPKWDKSSLESLIEMVDSSPEIKQAMKEGIDKFSK